MPTALPDWCRLSHHGDAGGSLTLDTPHLHVVWSRKTYGDGGQGQVISDIRLPDGGNLLGDQLDGSWGGRGVGGKVLDPPTIEAVHAASVVIGLTHDGGAQRRRIRIHRDRPVLGIEYHQWLANLVDLTRLPERDIAAGEVWRQERQRAIDAGEPAAEDPEGHHRLTGDYLPTYPNPLTFRSNWPGVDHRLRLTHQGWSIHLLRDPETGMGLVRLMDADGMAHLKVLQTGFEYFPCWGGERRPFRSVIGLVRGSAAACLEQAAALAESIPACEL